VKLGGKRKRKKNKKKTKTGEWERKNVRGTHTLSQPGTHCLDSFSSSCI